MDHDNRMRGTTMNARILSVVALVAAVSACQRIVPAGDQSPRFALPPDSVLELHRTVEVPRGQYNAYIQYGEVSAAVESRYESYCYLRVMRSKSALANPFTIEPGEFRLVGKDLRKDNIAGYGHGIRVGGVWVASAVTPVRLTGVFMDSADGGSNRYLNTVMALESATQPEVSSLVCGVFADPSLGRHLSLEQIRAVLGDVATIRAAP
jgi:hypothetical protein